jgi:hypothetical protein
VKKNPGIASVAEGSLAPAVVRSFTVAEQAGSVEATAIRYAVAIRRVERHARLPARAVLRLDVTKR